MFYLLEDNRIIDSEKTKYFDLYTRFGFLLEIDGETVIKNLGKIKKQSENVYELIESGDLVLTSYGSLRKIKENKNNIVITEFRTSIEYKDIIIIYKPSSNGDYIKVWEKKDNEVE